MDSQPPACRGSHDSYAQLRSNDAIVSQLAQQDNVPWYRKPNLRLLYLLMFPTCIGVEITSGFDGSILNGLQTVTSWLDYFGHPRSALLGFIVSMYALGSISAVPFAPFAVDKLGRRYPILLAGLVSIMAAIIQGFALNLLMFTAGRFMLGFANTFSIISASSLIGELSYPKERTVLSGLFNSCYSLGSVAAAGATLWTFSMSGNWGWRIPSLLQMAPSLLQVVFIWFIPESPRWLISKGRKDDVYAILVKYHGEGDKGLEFIDAEYVQIEKTLEAELKIAQEGWGVFSTPGMRRRVVVTVFLGISVYWTGLGLMIQYLSLILDNSGIHDSRTKNIINFSRSIFGYVNATVLVLIVTRYPRRKIFLLCTISVLVVFIAWTAASANYSLTHSKISAQLSILFIFLFSPAYNMGFDALTYGYLVELFPFHVRARGIAIYLWSSRLAAFISQVLNPIGMEVAGWRWYIVYCVWDAIQVVFVYFMFPETSGRTLEELTFLYEDDREALTNQGIQTLHENRATETQTHYGTMGQHPRRRTAGGGQR